jgi:SAM-dependent methyltransferase
MLPQSYFERHDESDDEGFYTPPRLVTHIDDAAIAAVTQLYREFFPPGGAILDLMSSWVSHLPTEIVYRRVVGLGMNRAELDVNPCLHERIVQNLNRNPRLPFSDAEFDGAGICVSVQYLTQPLIVFRELGRVLRPGAPLVVTFSNRCFPTKAVAIWQAQDDRGHERLVRRYFEEAGNWTGIEVLDRSPRRWRGDPLFAVIGRADGSLVDSPDHVRAAMIKPADA